MQVLPTASRVDGDSNLLAKRKRNRDGGVRRQNGTSGSVIATPKSANAGGMRSWSAAKWTREAFRRFVE